jgi:hypothetical protein
MDKTWQIRWPIKWAADPLDHKFPKQLTPTTTKQSYTDNSQSSETSLNHFLTNKESIQIPHNENHLYNHKVKTVESYAQEHQQKAQNPKIVHQKIKPIEPKQQHTEGTITL